MTMILMKDEIDMLGEIVQKELLDAGADHVIIVDLAGNLILDRGKLDTGDIMSLAVLSAANFAATSQIARLIGEADFTLMFHKGDKRNIHFNKLGQDYIIITLFDDGVSLGLIRLKSTKAIEQLKTILDGAEGRHRWPL